MEIEVGEGVACSQALYPRDEVVIEIEHRKVMTVTQCLLKKREVILNTVSLRKEARKTQYTPLK